MPSGWGGADPVEVVDVDDYELATEYLCNQDVTVTHVRVWTGAGEVGIANRKGRIWSTAGSQLGIASMPTDLDTGWTTHALDTPVERLAGSRFKVSFMTGGNEGALANALDSEVNSGDGALTAVAAASGTHGNGSFNLTAGSFPTTASGSNAFYGADVVYTLGVGGNTSPRITELTATPAGATVTAVVVAVDDELLTGASYRFVWGDGTADTVTSHPTTTAQHTYTASDTYAVLVTVTDSEGAADYEAVPVEVVVPDSGVNDLTQARVEQLLAALESHALASGWFERVNGHEPRSMPSSGLTAAVWFDRIVPLPQASGLNITSYLLTLMVRIYINGDSEPLDDIDPTALGATAALMRAYSGAFELGGLVREVDLLGEYGTGMFSQAGWMPMFDNARMRVMTITVPLVADNVWEQVA